jgi:hypothetical protein
MSAGVAKAPAEKTPLAANTEPVPAMLRKSRLDDVVIIALFRSFPGTRAVTWAH